MHNTWKALIIGIALLFPMAAFGQEEATEKQIREIQLDIRALELIHRLDLEKKQTRQLVDWWDQMEQLRTEHQKEMLSLLSEKKALLSKEKVDREKLIKVEGQMKVQQTEFETQNRILRARLATLLNEKQGRVFREVLEGTPERELLPHPSEGASPKRMIPPPKVGPLPEIKGRGPQWPTRPSKLEREFKLRKKGEDARQRRAVLKRMIEILKEKK